MAPVRTHRDTFPFLFSAPLTRAITQRIHADIEQEMSLIQITNDLIEMLQDLVKQVIKFEVENGV